jgi:hypothetical protein
MLSIVDRLYAAVQTLATVDLSPVRHAWLVIVPATFVNGVVMWHRARETVADNPALAGNYRRLICKILMYVSFPWLVLGAALEFMLPFPAVLAIFSCGVFVSWLVGFYWLFFCDGAETMAENANVFHRRFPRDPRKVKALYLYLICSITILVPVIAFMMMITESARP